MLLQLHVVALEHQSLKLSFSVVVIVVAVIITNIVIQQRATAVTPTQAGVFGCTQELRPLDSLTFLLIHTHTRLHAWLSLMCSLNLNIWTFRAKWSVCASPAHRTAFDFLINVPTKCRHSSQPCVRLQVVVCCRRKGCVVNSRFVLLLFYEV